MFPAVDYELLSSLLLCSSKRKIKTKFAPCTRQHLPLAAKMRGNRDFVIFMVLRFSSAICGIRKATKSRCFQAILTTRGATTKTAAYATLPVAATLTYSDNSARLRPAG